MNTLKSSDAASGHTRPRSSWDRLTGRLLKNWAAAYIPPLRIRERILSRAGDLSPGWNWIERSYWIQNGAMPKTHSYPGVLNPLEIRALSLHSLTLCAMLQPGMITHT